MENKEIFDYDEYVKSNEKGGKPKKNGFRRNKNNGGKGSASPDKKDKSAEEKKPVQNKQTSPDKKDKPAEEKKPVQNKQTPPDKKDKPAEEKKPVQNKQTPPDKKDKPAEEKKPEQNKQTPPDKKDKPAEEKKPVQNKQTSPDKKDKPSEEKKPEQNKQTPSDKKDKPTEKKENSSEALKKAGKKIHSGNDRKNKSQSDKREERAKVKEESIDSIKKMFDGALGEDSAEMAELTAEEPVPEMPEPKAVDRSKLYFMLGLAVAFFAVIGIISTVMFSAEKVREFTDNTQQKEEFARFIYPVVICDPAPFNEVMKIHNDTILMSAIWDVILYEDKSKYVQDFDYITVPEVDIEKHAVKLFGDGISLVHKSLLASEVKFYYEEELNSYRIPAKPRYFTYSPYVEGIERNGNDYILSVGYISPTPAYFDLNSKNETPTPDKYVEYVVRKMGDEYTLIEINISDKGRDPNLGL